MRQLKSSRSIGSVLSSRNERAIGTSRPRSTKERPFGLANSEGNHGEDAKEYYFYLDSTPTHSYLKNIRRRPIPIQISWRPNRRRVGKSDHEGFQQQVNESRTGCVNFNLNFPENGITVTCSCLTPPARELTENPVSGNFASLL
jgi:hypothetical protein